MKLIHRSIEFPLKSALKSILHGAAVAALAVGLGQGALAAGKTPPPKLIVTIDSFGSEYWAEFLLGVNEVAASVNMKPEVIASDYDGQKLLSQFSGLVAGGCENCAVVTSPTSVAFLKPMADRSATAKAKMVSVWNRPDNLHPWDTHPEVWAVHTAFDGVEGGYRNGAEVCKALGGKGGVGIILGVPDNPPSKQRLAGVKKALAECPDVKVLETQVGGWEQAKAREIALTWIGKHGDKLNAVISQNDAMALGVVAALKEKGLAGKVFVTGSDGTSDVLNLIKQGQVLSTTLIDPHLQGALATAFAYAAASGDIEPQKFTQAQRDFYLKEVLVTKENVDEVLRTKKSGLKYTYAGLMKDPWAHSSGQIPLGANR